MDGRIHPCTSVRVQLKRFSKVQKVQIMVVIDIGFCKKFSQVFCSLWPVFDRLSVWVISHGTGKFHPSHIQSGASLVLSHFLLVAILNQHYLFRTALIKGLLPWEPPSSCIRRIVFVFLFALFAVEWVFGRYVRVSLSIPHANMLAATLCAVHLILHDFLWQLWEEQKYTESAKVPL